MVHVNSRMGVAWLVCSEDYMAALAGEQRQMVAHLVPLPALQVVDDDAVLWSKLGTLVRRLAAEDAARRQGATLC